MIKFLRSSGIYIIAGLLIFVYAFARQDKDLSPAQFAEKIRATPNAQVVDVRTPEEFADGYISRARNIDWNDDAFEKKVLKLDKSKPTFVYCLSGGRSREAAGKMRSLGFTNVYELSGGFRKWRSEGLPVQSGKEKPTGLDMLAYGKLLNDKRLVLVDIYAKWCAPCKKMAPYLDELEKSEASWLKIIRLDADANIALADELKVEGLPTLYLYLDGNKKWSHAGFISRTDLLEQIKKYKR